MSPGPPPRGRLPRRRPLPPPCAPPAAPPATSLRPAASLLRLPGPAPDRPPPTASPDRPPTASLAPPPSGRPSGSDVPPRRRPPRPIRRSTASASWAPLAGPAGPLTGGRTRPRPGSPRCRISTPGPGGFLDRPDPRRAACPRPRAAVRRPPGATGST